MVPECSEITFSGEQALKQGQEVVFITERAVFTLTGEGVVLTEAAPGVDIKKISSIRWDLNQLFQKI